VSDLLSMRTVGLTDGREALCPRPRAQAARSLARNAHCSGKDRTMSSDEDRLWDAKDVASYLKVSRSWVYHRAEGGELPCLRIGGLLRFDPEAVRAFARGLTAAGGRVVRSSRP
jgi:excisionase family DNA binding protein